MRALSGAIITAAALIGLGLTAQGLGTRYAHYYDRTDAGVVNFDKSQVKLHELDNPMKLALTLEVLSVLIGLAITFVGLAYHHQRRHLEYLERKATSPTASQRITV